MLHTFKKQIPITPANSDFGVCHAFYVGVSGTVVLTDETGQVATWTCPAGMYIFCPGVRVAASSTATGIIGLVE